MVDVRVFAGAEQLVAGCADDIVALVSELQTKFVRPPRIVLTGGRLGQALVSALAQADTKFDPAGIVISWGDERLVPYASADSNSGEALRRFPGLARGKVLQFLVSDDLLSCRDRSDAELADQLAESEGEPLFDLVLLGVGEDGHVASLFPSAVNPPAAAHGLVAAVADSPKPPAQRLTLTLNALNRSRAVWFLAAGQEKRWAVERSMNLEGAVPASLVRGLNETRWYLDEGASPANK